MESETEEIDYQILDELINGDSDEDGDKMEDVPKKKSKTSSDVGMQLTKLNQLKSNQNLSNVTTVKIPNLINTVPGVNIKAPESKIAIQKSAAHQSEIEKPTIYVFCATCNRLVLENELCSACKIVAKKSSKQNNFLVHFSLISRVKRLMTMHYNAIKNHINRDRSDAFFTDIDDGKLFCNITELFGPNLIALTLNADGATLNNSGRKQLWPVQLYLNSLPPSIRYLPENIIITTLYFGERKPSMNDLLYPLSSELESCANLSVQTSANDFICFYIRVLIFAYDLPARSAIQNFIGPNGYFGCPYCYHEGNPIKNLANTTTVRYPKKENVPIRTHNETIELMRRVESGSKVDLKGIKGVSPIIAFPRGYDMINSFSIDYMHGIALGIAKDLIKIWIGKRSIPKPPNNDFKLSPKNREILKERMLKLKPTNNFRRMPRSILDISDFKSSEVMNCVWYYIR